MKWIGVWKRAYWLSGWVVLAAFSGAQPLPPPPASEAKPEVQADPFGRDRPRGTVLGFLNVARKGDWEGAVQYLNGAPRGEPGQELARQLFVVLDRRLPARLNQVSDRPEGSLSFPARPNEDLVGIIDGDNGSVEITVERVDQVKANPIWLFSRATLNKIPELYSQVDEVSVERVLPAWLVESKILQVPLFNWLAALIGLPAIYLLVGGLSRIFRLLVARILDTNKRIPDVAPPPVRLLLLALAIRWALNKFDLPLLARQFWSSFGFVITVAACVWLLILLNGQIEARVRKRLFRTERTGMISFVRFARRTVDGILIITGVLAYVYYFGLNPTAALAGLGVGGIAVALAAQKTLENVLGGISLILDHPVRIGEAVKVGDTVGTVEDIGLRSTRIRTLDRTVVFMPNGHLANLTLENFSRRDKFWMRGNVNLSFETKAAEMHSARERVKSLLLDHSYVEDESVRVNVVRIGISGFEMEIVAYLLAHDWPHFQELQGEILLALMETLEESGARIAFPSQTMYFASGSEAFPGRSQNHGHNGSGVAKQENRDPPQM